MTIKKKRTKIILPSILTVSLTCGLLLTGCQKTPDQSAVVSKAGGLSEDVIAEPIERWRDTDTGSAGTLGQQQ